MHEKYYKIHKRIMPTLSSIRHFILKWPCKRKHLLHPWHSSHGLPNQIAEFEPDTFEATTSKHNIFVDSNSFCFNPFKPIENMISPMNFLKHVMNFMWFVAVVAVLLDHQSDPNFPPCPKQDSRWHPFPDNNKFTTSGNKEVGNKYIQYNPGNWDG